MLRSESRVLIVCVVCGLVAVTVPEPARGQPRYAMMVDAAFSRDGSLVATCGDKVRVYEVKTGKLRRVIDGKITRAVAFSPTDTELFASAGDDGVVRVWRLGKEEAVHELKGHDGMVANLAFQKGGRLLASTSARVDMGKYAQGQLRLWDVETGKQVNSLEVKGAGITGLSFSSDGELLAFCRHATKAVSPVDVYRVRTLERVTSVLLTAGELKGEPFGSATAFAHDDKRLYIAGGVCVPLSAEEAFPYKEACRTTGLLWGADVNDAASAKLLEEPRLGYYRAVGVSPEGKRFATGNGSFGKEGKQRIELRDAERGRVIWRHERGAGTAYGITLSPDGKLVAYLDRGEVHLLNAETGEAIRSIGGAD